MSGEELPACECMSATSDEPYWYECEACECLRTLGITRADYEAMRAAAARVGELEALVIVASDSAKQLFDDFVTAREKRDAERARADKAERERDEARVDAEHSEEVVRVALDMSRNEEDVTLYLLGHAVTKREVTND